MTLNRNTGLALGFGIGIIIAAVFFGANWMFKNGGNLLKTQALQNTVPSIAPTTRPVQRVVTAPATLPIDPNDTIVNRMAPPQNEVINDIQKNLQELYGSNKTR